MPNIIRCVICRWYHFADEHCHACGAQEIGGIVFNAHTHRRMVRGTPLPREKFYLYVPRPERERIIGRIVKNTQSA